MTNEMDAEVNRATVGRYYAEHVRLSRDRESYEQLQGVLDTAEAKEWHLVGVAGGLPDGGVVLFWDIKRPSFGRTSRL